MLQVLAMGSKTRHDHDNECDNTGRNRISGRNSRSAAT